MNTNIKDMYKIIYDNKRNQPKYVLNFEMDSNDGDYVEKHITFSEEQWNNLPEFFFLMLAYLGKGYRGKFSNGESWGNYYGHHWEENAHGFANMIDAFGEIYEIMCYNEWGNCHSFSNFDLEYYDSDNKQYQVIIPNIDNMFNTEEEMISEMYRSYEEWKKIVGYEEDEYYYDD